MLAISPGESVNIRRRARAFGLVCALAGVGAAGCADFARVSSMSPGSTPADNPLAAQVRAAERTRYPLPSFRDVPPVPTDVRPPQAFAQAVEGGVAARDRLKAWVADNPPEVPLGPQDTEAYAASQRARIPAGERQLSPQPAGTDEFAARLRALAKPPPPPR